MTKDLFLRWIDHVWERCSRKFERTLLILDEFSVHRMDVVTEKLSKYKTDVLFIPAGLTYRLHPLDIYINKSMKDKLRHFWEDHVIQDTIPLTKSNKIKKPTKEMVLS